MAVVIYHKSISTLLANIVILRVYKKPRCDFHITPDEDTRLECRNVGLCIHFNKTRLANETLLIIRYRCRKAVFHRSRFARADEATDFNPVKSQSRGHAKKVKCSQLPPPQALLIESSNRCGHKFRDAQAVFVKTACASLNLRPHLLLLSIKSACGGGSAVRM